MQRDIRMAVRWSTDEDGLYTAFFSELGVGPVCLASEPLGQLPRRVEAAIGDRDHLGLVRTGDSSSIVPAYRAGSDDPET
jgi:hypothetical protein